MLTLTLIAQALHYQQTVCSILCVERIPKEMLVCILTKWKLLTNNTGEKFVCFYLPSLFIFVKLGQTAKII